MESDRNRRVIWVVGLVALQKAVDQNEDLSGNSNDGFLSAQLSLMGPKPGMELAPPGPDSDPGYLAENDFEIGIPRQDTPGFHLPGTLVISWDQPRPRG